LGADRVVLAFLTEAYDEEVVDAEKNDTRVVMHFHPALAPYKCAVLPLQKNLSEKADEIYAKMMKKFPTTYDLTGSIGKRYRRQDEIGTPYCVTIDFQTLEDGTVTVRDRDTMEQIRVSVDEAIKFIEEKLEF
jgi:glycyl-tRNA synthetase